MQSLEQVLEYENDAVLTKFRDYYGVSADEAAVLFRETKRWMWLCASRPDEVEMVIQDPLLMLDNMWHTFILFTRDYEKFCRDAFGKYVHHFPVTSVDKIRAQHEIDTSDDAREAHRRKLTRFYEYVYDQLGADVFELWYVEFANRYTPAYIRACKEQTEASDAEYHAPTIELKGRSKDEVIKEIVAGRFRNQYCRSCGMYCTCRTNCDA